MAPPEKRKSFLFGLGKKNKEASLADSFQEIDDGSDDLVAVVPSPVSFPPPQQQTQQQQQPLESRPSSPVRNKAGGGEDDTGNGPARGNIKTRISFFSRFTTGSPKKTKSVVKPQLPDDVEGVDQVVNLFPRLDRRPSIVRQPSNPEMTPQTQPPQQQQTQQQKGLRKRSKSPKKKGGRSRKATSPAPPSPTSATAAENVAAEVVSSTGGDASSTGPVEPNTSNTSRGDTEQAMDDDSTSEEIDPGFTGNPDRLAGSTRNATMESRDLYGYYNDDDEEETHRNATAIHRRQHSDDGHEADNDDDDDDNYGQNSSGTPSFSDRDPESPQETQPQNPKLERRSSFVDKIRRIGLKRQNSSSSNNSSNSLHSKKGEKDDPLLNALLAPEDDDDEVEIDYGATISRISAEVVALAAGTTDTQPDPPQRKASMARKSFVQRMFGKGKKQEGTSDVDTDNEAPPGESDATDLSGTVPSIRSGPLRAPSLTDLRDPSDIEGSEKDSSGLDSPPRSPKARVSRNLRSDQSKKLTTSSKDEKRNGDRSPNLSELDLDDTEGEGERKSPRSRQRRKHSSRLKKNNEDKPDEEDETDRDVNGESLSRTKRRHKSSDEVLGTSASRLKQSRSKARRSNSSDNAFVVDSKIQGKSSKNSSPEAMANATDSKTLVERSAVECCARCGQAAGAGGLLVNCARCKATSYCSTKCFSQDMPSHLKVCPGKVTPKVSDSDGVTQKPTINDTNQAQKAVGGENTMDNFFSKLREQQNASGGPKTPRRSDRSVLSLSMDAHGRPQRVDVNLRPPTFESPTKRRDPKASPKLTHRSLALIDDLPGVKSSDRRCQSVLMESPSKRSTRGDGSSSPRSPSESVGRVLKMLDNVSGLQEKEEQVDVETPVSHPSLPVDIREERPKQQRRSRSVGRNRVERVVEDQRGDGNSDKKKKVVAVRVRKGAQDGVSAPSSKQSRKSSDDGDKVASTDNASKQKTKLRVKASDTQLMEELGITPDDVAVHRKSSKSYEPEKRRTSKSPARRRRSQSFVNKTDDNDDDDEESDRMHGSRTPKQRVKKVAAQLDFESSQRMSVEYADVASVYSHRNQET